MCVCGKLSGWSPSSAVAAQTKHLAPAVANGDASTCIQWEKRGGSKAMPPNPGPQNKSAHAFHHWAFCEFGVLVKMGRRQILVVMNRIHQQ
jgi:hypothetical protein